MSRAPFPRFGSPDSDRGYAERYGAPRNYDLPGGRYPSRTGQPNYNSDSEDDDHRGAPQGRRGVRVAQDDQPPEDINERIQWRLNRLREAASHEERARMDPYGGARGPGMRPPSPRRGSFPRMPARGPCCAGGMPGYDGRPGYGSENGGDGYEGDLAGDIQRLMGAIRAGGRDSSAGGRDPYGGGRDPYSGGDGPYGMGPGPSHEGYGDYGGPGGYGGMGPAGGYGGMGGLNGRPRPRRNSFDSSRGGGRPQCPTQ